MNTKEHKNLVEICTVGVGIPPSLNVAMQGEGRATVIFTRCRDW